MNKVLITGSTGFIGKALKQKLIDLGYEMAEFNTANGDITDISAFSDYDMESIEHIYHLSAKTFVPDSWSSPTSFYNVNVMGTLNILELCRKHNISLTFISSYLYGEPDKLPISEEASRKPNNPYAHSKHLAEQLCEFYSNNYGIKICVIRPFNVYGIGQRKDFLIPTIISKAIYENEIIVKDLEPKRDYIYIDDLINAIILAQNSKKLYSVYNIGSGYSVSVKQIIDVVLKILKVNKPVISEMSSRKNEIFDVVADISKANEELGWYPSYSIEEGLRKLIEAERWLDG